uniref:Uncharacterized protein n=1 Tax=Trichogramma kaykai TaxID=54128 RepID=A0ABD2X442_9HYME
MLSAPSQEGYQLQKMTDSPTINNFVQKQKQKSVYNYVSLVIQQHQHVLRHIESRAQGKCTRRVNATAVATARSPCLGAEHVIFFYFFAT